MLKVDVEGAQRGRFDVLPQSKILMTSQIIIILSVFTIPGPILSAS